MPLLIVLLVLAILVTCLCKVIVFNKIVCILYSIFALIMFVADFDPASHAMVFGFGLWIYSAPALSEDTRDSVCFLFEGRLYEILFGDHPIITVIAGTLVIPVIAVLYAWFEQVAPLVGPLVGLIVCVAMIPINIIGLTRHLRDEF